MNLDEVISATYGPRLTTVGFEQVRPRKWVRDRGIGIREIFQIQSIRIQYSARWGFSVDPVPLYRNGRFRWKRTSKTCDFDLCIDPIDESGPVPEWCSFVHAAGHQECNPADLSEIESGTWRRASLDFDRIHEISDVCDFLEERSHFSSGAFLSRTTFKRIWHGALLCTCWDEMRRATATWTLSAEGMTWIAKTRFS